MVTGERGKFIVFEGMDGSGKSTQAYLLTRHLGENRIRAMGTREPGGTDTGEEIRRILLEVGGEELSPECEMLLFMASRAQHIKVIKPLLERGTVVVCERFNWSSIAYQGYAGGLDIEEVERIAELAAEGLTPDLTIVLDLDVDVAQERELMLVQGNQHNRIERKGAPFQQKVRQGFLDLAAQHPERSRVVDASRPPKEVHEDVKKLVADVLCED